MRFSYAIFTLGLAIAISGATTAQAVTSAASTVPMTTYHQGNQTVTVPDWTKMTFATVPHLPQSGRLSRPDTTSIRQWQRGQSITDVLTLGDLQDSFRLQHLNLYAIAVATNMAPDDVSLGRLKLMQRQTIRSLMTAIPTIADVPINQIPPIADLIATTKLPPQLAALTLTQLLGQTPAFGDLRFEAIPLDQYHLTDIPDLLLTPFSKFENWQEARISDIPNLVQMPWSELPNPPVNGGMIAIVKAVKATGQAAIFTSISGSDQAGYAVGCASKPCSGITFQGNTALDQKLWTTSSTQVPGGQGDWQILNEGKEPAGRSVFTHAFKIAIVQTQPEIKTALFFRACHMDSGNSLNCSPYVIGGIPLQTLHDGDAMLVGEIPVTAAEPALPQLNDPSPAPILLPHQNAPTQDAEPSWREWIHTISMWVESIKNHFS